MESSQVIAGHYRLVERIGSGGTGVVWRAIDERLGRVVAIKQIPIQPSLPDSERELIRQRAIREARNASKLQHPNAIVFFDITESNGDPCLVMEYFEGKSMSQILARRSRLPLSEVAQIGRQAAAALAAAHKAGLVHRDVKPGNILIDDHGKVKITDFGISKAVGDTTLTATGLVSGTAAYIPPEIARGAEPTPASDVFGLGATLFHALEGEPPYGLKENPLAILYAAANGQVSTPHRAGPATDLMTALLDPDPRNRPSMQETENALAQFVNAGPVKATATQVMPTQRTAHIQQPIPVGRPIANAGYATPREPYPVVKPKRRTGLGYLAAVIAVLVALGGVIWGISNLDGGIAGLGLGNGTEQTDDLGKTESDGTVNGGAAATLIDSFYTNLISGSSTIAQSWDMLTPAAQKVYGSQDEFVTYWKAHGVTNYRNIQVPSPNQSDGSIDVTLASLTAGGTTKSLTFHIVMKSGKMLIDSDTR
ncbi:MAG: serine/threonine protein kinase [Nocardiaceae bacterium]|nr:serine/threonine protein kinase [Nocardiaceae bacterium]